MSNRVICASDTLYRLLLHLYPAEHRRDYGVLMAQTFHDMLQAAYTRNGTPALIPLWIEALADIVTSVTIEHRSILIGRQIMSKKSMIVLSFAFVLSILTGYVNITATEVQAPMLCILLFSFLSGLIQPKGAWRWAILIGLSIPVSTFVGLAINFKFPDAPPHYPITLVVLVLPALVAAYAGVLTKRLLTGIQHQPSRPG